MQHSHDMASDRQEAGKGAARKGAEIWLLTAQREPGLPKRTPLGVLNYARMVTCKTQNFPVSSRKIKSELA
ncbi:MAG: hypothetical protein RBJ76_02010 [Stenomitos frigidus ULC029]